MEKKIILKMQPSKDIVISLNDQVEIFISKDNRTVKADDIYSLLGYERGDTYTVIDVNEQNVDVPVLKFFTDLFRDITERLNQISTSQNDDMDENIEA